MRRRASPEQQELHRLLTLDLSPTGLRLQQRELDALAARCSARGGPPEPLRLLRFLVLEIDETTTAIYGQRRTLTEFNRRLAKAASPREQAGHLLDFARALGARNLQLLGDRLALRRWLGRDAMQERYEHRQAQRERTLRLLLERLGAIAAAVLRAEPARWAALDLEAVCRPLLAYDGDGRIRLAAFQALATALRALPEGQREGRVDDVTLRYLYRAALARDQETWIQTAAVRLLLDLAPERLVEVVRQRLTAPRPGDDFFVRASAVAALGEVLARVPSAAALLSGVAEDPSPYVRQTLVWTLRSVSQAQRQALLPRLLQEDPEPSVRAAAALLVGELDDRSAAPALRGDWIAAALARETDTQVVRILLEAAAAGSTAAWRARLLPQLETLHQQAPALAVRRQAARAREWLWLRADPVLRMRHAQLAALIAAIPPGGSQRLPRSLLAGLQPEQLERMLALLAQDDFPLELVQGATGLRLCRGHRFGFRTWRLLHELRNPSSDKRQAYDHSRGRLFAGLRHAPSGCLDELAATKVPGEPLHMADEDGWRPYLPLLDQALSSLDQGWPTRPLRLYTAEGVTELLPPSGLARRLWARLRITWGFATLAGLRNWRPDDRESARAYLDALLRLGFRVRFRTHPGPDGQPYGADPAVLRFFPAVLPVELEAWWSRAWDYFFSLYENSLFHLAIFVAAVSALFIGQHLVSYRLLRRARRRLPLVIGGWGTRGKSGTERLKAALFNALGYSVVSKTTGCEAMFLYSRAHGRLREMYLFRPYDKATIVEQAFVVRLAARLGTEVFLWECMGLTPSYIHVLQRQWMRDDLATITNTYPDHEDLQGPAGIDIPQVMCNFIPERSRLLTTEEQMLPILRVGAESVGTRLVSLGWRAAALLTPDVLARFPYQEHPYNVALVLELARELEIPSDFALKEMADRVVPDLGVLKTYPRAQVAGRILEFVMGMSANERYGAISNWSRTGFDRLARATSPGVWVATVVNNRADRVPRSRVFADLLAGELSADCHLLIGGNLQGLLGYLQEAWATRMASTSLWDDQQSRPEAQRRWRQMAAWLRLPLSDGEVRERLAAMLEGCGIRETQLADHWRDPQALAAGLAASLADQDPATAAALVAALQRDLAAWEDFRGLDEALGAETEVPRLERRYQELARRHFMAKLVVVEDYHASGDQLVLTLAQQTPPGLLCRIMGLQNIKGTGLDFVYRWQAWDQCHRACEQLESEDAREARVGLSDLAKFQDYGLLCEQRVEQTLERVRHALWAQREDVQAELEGIASSLRLALERVRGTLGEQRRVGWSASLLKGLEAFFDAGDAVRRRKQANRIYRDLANERISSDRAALELQRLTKRQKGGWLTWGG